MQEVNGNSDRVSVGTLDETPGREASAFFDKTAPEFSAPKENPIEKKKPWKRKLIVWSLILLVIAAGVFALYVLVRVKRVEVRVNAESQRPSQTAKTEASPNNSESGLSAEAINIARQAMGADQGTAANASSANTSTSKSTSTSPDAQPTLNFGDNSPAYAHLTDTKPSDLSSNEPTSTANRQAPEQSSSPTQSHANPTQTLFVEDLPSKASSIPQVVKTNSSATEKRPESTKASNATPPAVLPVFGTMLPVRTRGVIFSVRANSYARLELARDCVGEGWSLPKGTLLIGRVNGSDHDRAFINILGYIDPGTNRLVKMTGEVIGSDGGAGIQGKRIAIDRNRLKETLGKIASGGLEVAGTMAGALIGRGTVVVNGAGYRALNPITDEAGQLVNAGDKNRHLVRIEAGQPAFVMVADLPPEVRAVAAPGEDDLTRSAASLTDREVMELIVFGTPEDVRAAQPLMNAEQKRLVLKSINPKE
jgi:cytoskeletal protein RodZ